jgi:hypothetical protein
MTGALARAFKRNAQGILVGALVTLLLKVEGVDLVQCR